MNITARDEEILKLKWTTDMSNKEITEQTGFSKSTINRVVNRYLMQRDVLERMWADGRDASTDATVAVADTTSVVPEPPHFVSEDVVTVCIDGKVFNFDKSHPNYSVIRDSVLDKDWNSVSANADFKKKFKTLTFGFFQITDDGRLLHHGEEVEYDFAERVIALNEKDTKPTALLKFLERLKSNPSAISVESAIRFIINNSLPIDKDGYIFTYKRIRSDYKDCHTGTVDNSVGNVVAMPREDVTLDPNQTCASGLHVCSYSYLSEFGGDRTVVCKVDPADIVSVPHDYKNAKMRVMRYEVVYELERGEKIPDDYIDETCDWYK